MRIEANVSGKRRGRIRRMFEGSIDDCGRKDRRAMNLETRAVIYKSGVTRTPCQYGTRIEIIGGRDRMLSEVEKMKTEMTTNGPLS